MIRLTLDRYLDTHGITRYELSKRTGVSFQIVDNYYKNKVIRYDGYVLDRFCAALGCGVSDLIEYTEADGEEK